MKLLQLKVVVWKNLIIRRRHWLLTIFESLLPIALFFLIAYGRSKISGLKKTEVSHPTYNDIEEIQKSINVGSTYILYTPQHRFSTSIIQRTANKFQMPSDKVLGFQTEEEMSTYYHKHHNDTIMAIVFSGNDPKNLVYTIRYHEESYSQESLSTNKKYMSFYQFQPGVRSPYIWKDLIALQLMLDLSFIEHSLNTSDIDNNITVATQEFPYPPYVADTVITTFFLEYLPLFTLFSFIFLCPAVLKRVVEEKHSGIKELLKMVGMESWMLWLGWFIYGMVPIIFSVSAIVFLMKVPLFGSEYPPIEHSNGFILFLFLLFYCMAATTFCFAISSWFSKPATAMVTGILIWILSYCIPKYSLGLDESNQLSWSVNILLNLLPNMALHYGYSAIAVDEERGLGMQWNNFYKSSSGGTDDVTMLNVFVMLWLDTVLFVLFTFYMDGVNPGKYGVPKSLLFPIRNLLEWVQRMRGRTNIGVDFETVHLEKVEEGHGMDKGIQIHQLCKRFGPKMAVDHLNLDIYRNQITVLLGHNGAGKSTTMSMITGMLQATSGAIKINGLDIKHHMQLIRQSLGLCPQHNLFFDDLTVREHLLFFAKLKGGTSEQAVAEADALLKELQLSEKSNSFAHTLSGGMKRKLCLGMALMGESKVLILDEPSSGMDPESRRELWDLLLAWRGKKTILITTHFMEEADALGDWIAIMSNGSLQCYGTPMFLKKKYNTGYHLSLMVSGEVTAHDIDAIKQEVAEHINVTVALKSQDGNNLVFVLPFESNANLPGLLSALETKKTQLKIDNISVTMTTLEDVFLKARVESDGKEDYDQIDSALLTKQDDSGSKESLNKMMISALFAKRFHFQMKKKLSYIIPLLIAVVFFCLTAYLTSKRSSQYSSNGPELKYRLDTYRETTAFYNSTPNDPRTDLMKIFYKHTVEGEGSDAIEVSNVEEAIIEKGVDNIAYYKEHLIASANFYVNAFRIEAVAMYNAIAIHSLPISVNLVTNTLAKGLLGGDYSISASYWPLKSFNNQESPTEYSQTMVAVLWFIMVPIACLFIHSSFIIFPHAEISTRFIRLQYMCGVKTYVYWLTNFFADLLMYLVMILLMVVLLCLASPPFRHLYEFGVLLVILLMYGLSGIPFSYLFSRKSSASAAFALFIILGIFLGIILALIIGVLIESHDVYYMNIGEKLKIVSLLFVPQVGLTSSVLNFTRRAVEVYNLQINSKRMQTMCNYQKHACCSPSSIECSDFKDYMKLLEENFLLMLASCFIYLVINVLLDSYTLRKWWCKFWFRTRRPFYRMLNGNAYKGNCKPNHSEYGVEGKNTLDAKNLSKTYSGRTVVRNIDFTLKDGDCLGILGVNGAGKSTTFGMLTRDVIVDDGSICVQLEDRHIDLDQDEYMQTLGYCPQADTLNYVLTGRQLLTTVAQLRGISHIDKVVEQFLKLFDLEEYADQPFGTYSGGNKRKLSLAVSLIGYRKVVLLDEPTNGVDPSSRRKLWNLIKAVQKNVGLSFILTSHSMTECEALCNQLMIMKDGQFVERGSLSELKRKFGGFSLKLKLHKGQVVASDEVDCFDASTSPGDSLKFADVEGLKEYFTGKGQGELKDEHAGLLHFYIRSDESKKWSDIFREVEEIKECNPHLIEDYAISEASLEDVFLKVARADDTVEEGEVKNKKRRL